jgi:hypothetical protein
MPEVKRPLAHRQPISVSFGIVAVSGAWRVVIDLLTIRITSTLPPR